MTAMPAGSPGDPLPQHPALITLTSHDEAALRLFCFPPAGAGPAFYLPWTSLLPPAIELLTFHLPGHGKHPSHVSATDPRRLVREITSLIPAQHPGGLGFFGHSIGALLAFETARQLRRDQSRIPDLLAVSGLPAPHTEILHANIVNGVLTGLAGRGDLTSLLPDEPGITTLKKVLHYAPVVADSLLILHYRYRDEAPLDTRLALYAGGSDPFVPIEALTAWNDLVTLPATPRLYPGNHVYLSGQAPAVLEQLVKDLRAATETPAA
jgi:surfactin synthase thioesterase subunit